MIAEAIEKILKLAPANLLTIDGRQYSDKVLHPCLEPTVPTLTVNTLNGLVEFFVANLGEELGDCRKNVFIHVLSPTEVRICSDAGGPFHQRNVHVIANRVEYDVYPFGHWQG